MVLSYPLNETSIELFKENWRDYFQNMTKEIVKFLIKCLKVYKSRRFRNLLAFFLYRDFKSFIEIFLITSSS